MTEQELMEIPLTLVVRSDGPTKVGKIIHSGREAVLIQGKTHREVAQLFLNWWEEQRAK